MRYADYLRKRLDYLERCNAHIEEKLEDDKEQLCSRLNSGELNPQDRSYKDARFEIEIIAQTFRYSMLVAICTFLEESINSITEGLVPDYHMRLKNENRGTWLRKHLQMLAWSAGLDMKPIEKEQSMSEDIILLRNTIAHAWGRVQASKAAPKLREIVCQYQWVEITGDGFFELTDQAIPETMIVPEEIIDHILRLPGAETISLQDDRR